MREGLKIWHKCCCVPETSAFLAGARGTLGLTRRTLISRALTEYHRPHFFPTSCLRPTAHGLSPPLCAPAQTGGFVPTLAAITLCTTTYHFVQSRAAHYLSLSTRCTLNGRLPQRTSLSLSPAAGESSSFATFIKNSHESFKALEKC